MSNFQNPIDFVHGFVGAILPIKQTLISIKFSTHKDAITKLYLLTLILCDVIVGHVTLKGQITLKGQVSKGNNRKSPWSIDFNFDVYLSWEGVYPKLALM